MIKSITAHMRYLYQLEPYEGEKERERERESQRKSHKKNLYATLPFF